MYNIKKTKIFCPYKFRPTLLHLTNRPPLYTLTIIRLLLSLTCFYSSMSSLYQACHSHAQTKLWLDSM